MTATPARALPAAAHGRDDAGAAPALGDAVGQRRDDVNAALGDAALGGAVGQRRDDVNAATRDAALGEVLRALAALAEPPSLEHAAIAAALGLPPPAPADEYTDALVFQLPPYASIYLGAEGLLGGEARDRISGFWRALGSEPPREPDHLVTLCAALAELTDTEAATGPGDARVRTARAALHWEHVASWMPPFLSSLRRIGSPFHASWATTLDDVLVADVAASRRLPLALRAAPALPDAPADLDDLLATVLAPIRIGMVITRDDLRRCAADLGLGLRAGERRFALRSLLGQDAPAALRWLASEADRQAEAYGTRSAIAAWWGERASVGATWLDRLARLADDAGP